MEATKRCPLCGEEILQVALRCKHCQADFRPASDAASTGAAGHSPARSPEPRPAPHYAGPNPAPTFSDAPYASPPRPISDPLTEQLTERLADRPTARGDHDASGRFRGSSDGAPHGNGASVPSGLVGYEAPAHGDFEQRFLDFAFRTQIPINGASVAYALKIPIDEANDQLEDLAARDVLVRDVDARGTVFFQLPGRPSGDNHAPFPTSTALTNYSQPPPLLYDPASSGILTRPPTESTALAGLLINVLFLPGLGSLIGGKTSAGVLQLFLFIVSLPLWFVFVGIPLTLGVWIWSMVTGVSMLNEAKQNAQLRGT